VKQAESENGTYFGWLSELQLQLADHEPVIWLNVSASEDSGLLNSFDVTSPEQNMINLVVGAVNCIGLLPRLQAHQLVLEDGVRQQQDCWPYTGAAIAAVATECHCQ